MARLDSNTFPALNESVLSKLHSRNIFTVYDFMLQTPENLIKKSDLSFKEIEDTRQAILLQFGGEVVDAYDVYKQELQDITSTGIKSLDNLLRGGLRCGNIYEICGFSSAGKSQLCHWISMQATLNASCTEVHYVDGSRNFCISRIQMMLEARHSSDSIIAQVMSNIKVYQIYKMSQAFTVLHHLSKLTNKDQNGKFSKKLIIVDSLSVLCAIVPNIELNSILSNFASICRYIVNHKCATVIVINTLRLEQGGQLLTEENKNLNIKPKIKPALGNYWLSIPNVRLLIDHQENSQREISIWNSYQLKNKESCFIVIKDEGIF